MGSGLLDLPLRSRLRSMRQQLLPRIVRGRGPMRCCRTWCREEETIDAVQTKGAVSTITYREALYAAMREALESNANALILGQGVTDHKGTFGTTSGLAEDFGHDRVLDTPLAEEGMMGVAVGAALNGLYPIQTHIRADFALVAMNQIVNLVAKYRYMFGGRFEIPMLIRMVIGRSWGQGAQHSQSLQSLFAHIPGLTVIMPATPESILVDYRHATSSFRGPVISLEHRLMYDLAFEKESQRFEPLSTRRLREGKDVTIVSTSIMTLEAVRAAGHLMEHGIDCEIIDLNCVSHPDADVIIDSVRKTGRLIVADTSWQAYGVSAEICRLVVERDPGALKSPVVTMGMEPAPCPTAKALEDIYYPNLSTLTDAIAKLVTGNAGHGLPLPDEQSMADVYKRFKGPF
ncbi:TPA: alpha-ketoacid dehydrogenase subunit beta [Candidatus Latescibacteria bacterium]|nr:alpha-ketoacid dehydrogenase subunit beta [Candidatus Latescibacterota bacterium]